MDDGQTLNEQKTTIYLVHTAKLWGVYSESFEGGGVFYTHTSVILSAALDISKYFYGKDKLYGSKRRRYEYKFKTVVKRLSLFPSMDSVMNTP